MEGGTKNVKGEFPALTLGTFRLARREGVGDCGEAGNALCFVYGI